MRRLILLAMLTLPLPVLAQDEAEDWPEGSAMNTGILAKARLEKADRELNVTYQRILKNLPADQDDDYPRKALVAAQRQWIKYRDAECALVGEVTGGVRMWKSANTVACTADLTEERTKELVKLFEDSGN